MIGLQLYCSARPQSRARIETKIFVSAIVVRSNVAPGLKAGRGLKHIYIYYFWSFSLVAPGLKAGRGLKLKWLVITHYKHS